LIGDIYRKNRNLGPTKAREELLKRMKEKGLDKNYGPDYPSVSSVSLQLKKCKENDDKRTPESKELDKPWSIGSLSKYPIPPEAIPLVSSIYEKCLIAGLSTEWLLSIREALWIGRLYKILEIYHSRHILPRSSAEEEALLIKLGHLPKAYQKIKLEDLILDWAYAYSGWEELSEINGESLFNSDEIDGELMNSIFSYYGERRRDFIDDMVEKYDIDDDEYKELQSMPLDDIQRFFQQLELKRGGKTK